MDEFQERYLAHQKRKKQVLIEIMRERHSNRMFADREVPNDVVREVVESLSLCPSSCDRHGVQARVVTDRDGKALLGGLLVGGVGWVHRAPVVILLMADPGAYKAGDEITFMPYLDAGVMVQQLYLKTTSLGLHGAFVNPNIRTQNKEHFERVFGSGIFCGAFALGYPHGEQGKRVLEETPGASTAGVRWEMPVGVGLGPSDELREQGGFGVCSLETDETERQESGPQGAAS